MRLKSIIGESAFWIPPRLWAYAAESQPDGDFSNYSDGEISQLIGYQGDSKALLVALKDCGWMDLDMKIHDWEEHNGFHRKFAARASTAATMRWEKEKEKKQKKEKTVLFIYFK